jgi:hypothetical protein
MSGFASAAKPKLLCVGDSLTAGYHFWGTEWFPYATTLSSLWEERYEVDHIGYSGWTTEKSFTLHIKSLPTMFVIENGQESTFSCNSMVLMSMSSY